jgi:hypothetical protein
MLCWTIQYCIVLYCIYKALWHNYVRCWGLALTERRGRDKEGPPREHIINANWALRILMCVCLCLCVYVCVCVCVSVCVLTLFCPSLLLCAAVQGGGRTSGSSARSGGSNRQSQRYDRNKFLQANFRFLVSGEWRQGVGGISYASTKWSQVSGGSYSFNATWAFG